MNQRLDKFEFVILIIVQFNSRFIQKIQKIQKIQVHLTALLNLKIKINQNQNQTENAAIHSHSCGPPIKARP
jgi:hypothetical protein